MWDASGSLAKFRISSKYTLGIFLRPARRITFGRWFMWDASGPLAKFRISSKYTLGIFLRPARRITFGRWFMWDASGPLAKFRISSKYTLGIFLRPRWGRGDYVGCWRTLAKFKNILKSSFRLACSP
jgi:hypothetical protein